MGGGLGRGLGGGGGGGIPLFYREWKEPVLVGLCFNM